MILRVLLVCLAGFLAGGFGLYCAARRAPASVRKQRQTKFFTYFLIVVVVLIAAALGRIALLVLFAALLCRGGYELLRVLGPPDAPPAALKIAAGLGFLLLAILLLFSVGFAEPREVAFVYLVVAGFDGFSQVAGQLLGKHQLAKRISPGKTVEGAMGGLLLAEIVGLATYRLVGLSAGKTAALCLVIAAAGLAGDLLASSVKRAAGVKDFGWVLPGHGGILDRFDSLLLAGPVALLLVHWRLF